MSIGKNTAAGLLADLGVFGLGMLVSIVLTRSLGPDQRGVYVLLTTTNFLVASVAHLSVGLACSTLLARGRLHLGEVNTAAVLLALALGALGFVAIVLAVQVPVLRESMLKGIPLHYWLVVAVMVPITIYQNYWNAMMTGLSRIVLMNKLNLGVNIGNALLMILVVGWLRRSVSGALTVWSMSALAGVVCAAVLAAKIEPFAWPPGRAIRDLLHFGVRGHGANIAQQLFLRFDLYAVNVLLGVASVGFYSIATSLTERLWLPINAIYSSSLGKIAQLPRQESALLTAKVTRTALLLMLSLALPFAAISPWLVPFLYGAAFQASVLPVIILVAGTLAFAVMIVLNSFILGQLERPGLLSIISWFELGVSIPLYIIFIAWLGIVGAAIASTLTYLIAMVCTLVVFLRSSGLSLGHVILPQIQDFRDYAKILQRGLRK